MYNHGSFGKGCIICAPGADYPNSDWIHPETKRPLQMTVKFKAGMAEVEDKLGDYLIEKRLAFSSPIFMPEVA